MNEKTIDRIINIIYSLSAIAILLGVFFKLQHYPFGSQLVWGGIIAHFFFSSIEISRLKKTIKKLEERNMVE
jgi:hypothetical protein